MARNTITIDVDSSKLMEVVEDVRNLINSVNKKCPMTYCDTDSCIVADTSIDTVAKAEKAATGVLRRMDKSPCEFELEIHNSPYVLGGFPTPYRREYILKTGSITDLMEASILINREVGSNPCVISGLFTDVGTHKKQVQEDVKITDDKRGKFINDLRACTRARKTISDDNYGSIVFTWITDKNLTRCEMTLNDVTRSGVATKHPEDIENEYIGKSLSFNRAFDKLEKAVNKGKPNHIYGVMGDPRVVGISLGNANMGKVVYVNAHLGVYRSIAGADIKKGDALYTGKNGTVLPKEYERPFYHGGIDFACESTCGCFPEGLVIIDDEWLKVERKKPESEVKSECTDKESDDITITMSRKDAECVKETLRKNDGNEIVYWTLIANLK